MSCGAATSSTTPASTPTKLELMNILHIGQRIDADARCSSGMCKAGFAGDDAPRAVFRKLPSLTQLSPPSVSVSGTDMCASFDRRSSPSPWVSFRIQTCWLQRISLAERVVDVADP